MRSASKYIHLISATDSCGGAGNTLDVRIASGMSFWPVCSISGITAQSFDKVFDVHKTPDEIFAKQLELSLDYNISAVKIGALFSMNQLKLVSEYLDKINVPVIYDPVFGPTNGKPFYNKEMIEFLKCNILSKISVIAPNINELEKLFHQKFNSISEAAIFVQKENPHKTTYYLKGGHFSGNELKEAIVDNKIKYVKKKKLNLSYSHGTGCMFSTFAACYLAKGLSYKRSFIKASKEVNKLLKSYF